MEAAVLNDPALAIGTAKELVETCCKTILQSREIDFSKSAELPELTKLTVKSLELTPDHIPDKAKLPTPLNGYLAIWQQLPEASPSCGINMVQGTAKPRARKVLVPAMQS